MKIIVTEHKLLEWLKANPEQSSKELAKHFGVTPPTLWKTLVPAVKAGLISGHHHGKTPFYQLTPAGENALMNAAFKVVSLTPEQPKPIKQHVTQFGLLSLLASHAFDNGEKGLTSKEIAQFYGVTPATVWKTLVPAKDEGLIQKTQTGKTRWYKLTQKGADWLLAQAKPEWKPAAAESKIGTKADAAPKVYEEIEEKLEPETVTLEDQIYSLLLGEKTFHGAASITLLMQEKYGKQLNQAAVKTVLETLVGKGLAKKAPYKTYSIYKAIAPEPAMKMAPVKKHITVKPWPTPVEQKVEEQEKVEEAKPNIGGADDVKLGEAEWLKQKEYGYKFVVGFKVLEAQAANVGWGGFGGEKKAAIDEWGLDATLNLKTECADFYALYDLSLDYPDVEPIFREKRDMLAAQFAAYIDMAVGGEFRHAANRCSNAHMMISKAPILQLVMNGKLPKERSACWRQWRTVRLEKGLDALKQVEHVYKAGHWSGSFGGIKWGKGAETLRLFLEGEITPTIFVDTVWSLQHNNGFILNKVWNTHGLDSILNAKFAGKIAEVVPHATEAVRKLWAEKKAA